MQTAQAYYAKPENRARALESARGKSCIAGSWGYAQRLALHAGGGVWELNARGERTGAYFCDKFPDGWRELARPKFSSMREEICGWYADSFQNETIEPHVLQLPSRGGEVHYVPATSRTDCDGVTLYLGDVQRSNCAGKADYLRRAGGDPRRASDDAEATLRDAWSRANRCAEIEAEHAREEDAKFQVERECERLAEESAELLAQILADRAAVIPTFLAARTDAAGDRAQQAPWKSASPMRASSAPPTSPGEANCARARGCLRRATRWKRSP